MKLIYSLFIAVIIFVLLIVNYYFFYGKTRVEVDLLKLKKQYVHGDTMYFDVKVTNISKTDKCFIIEPRIISTDNKIIFPKMMSIIPSKQFNIFEFNQLLSANVDRKKCVLELAVKSKLVNNEQVVNEQSYQFVIISTVTEANELKIAADKLREQEKAQITVSTKPVISVIAKPKKITPNIKFRFIQLPEKLSFNEVFNITGELVNTSEYAGNLLAKIELISSEPNAVPVTLAKEVYITSFSSGIIVFEYKIDGTAQESDYLINGQVYSLTKDNNPDKLMAGDNCILALTDKIPQIKILYTDLNVKRKQTAKYEVEVADDRQIKEVLFNYSGQAANDIKSEKMNLVSGDMQKGTWSYSLIIPKKIDKFTFTISAADSKEQTIKTEVFTVNIVK